MQPRTLPSVCLLLELFEPRKTEALQEQEVFYCNSDNAKTTAIEMPPGALYNVPDNTCNQEPLQQQLQSHTRPIAFFCSKSRTIDNVVCTPL